MDELINNNDSWFSGFLFDSRRSNRKNKHKIISVMFSLTTAFTRYSE